MKITGIDIGEYRQFKNIKFDFTYPEGHAKAGLPLDKVCFIGQSGTGKTTLLNVIWDFFQVVNDSYQRLALKSIPINDEPFKTFQNICLKSTYEGKDIFLDNTFLKNESEYVDLNRKLLVSSSGYHWLDSYNIQDKIKQLIQTGKLCLYLDEAAVSKSKNLLEEKDPSSRNTITLKGQYPGIGNTENNLDIQNNSAILSLGEYDSEKLWSDILPEIDIYDNALKQFAANLVSKNSFSQSRLVNQINQWQQEHPNPRADLADNCLNKIFRLFHLEVDIDGTEARIVLKAKRGEQIPGKFLSTGAKQLLTTSIPIYKTNLDGSVVLFDEPERSLFPDIQRELISHYTSLAPTAQFFFATHSPIIVSAFEPCERFILYFDENGEVNFHNGVAPEGDDPNDILSEDFGLDELMLPKGLEAYKRYRGLAVEIRNEQDTTRKDELIIERAKLGDLYRF